jgi:hypothetical protein
MKPVASVLTGTCSFGEITAGRHADLQRARSGPLQVIYLDESRQKRLGVNSPVASARQDFHDGKENAP